MESIEVQVLNTIIRAIVKKPDAVQVEKKVDEMGILLTIWTDPEDAGLVIGKQGASINKIRSAMSLVGAAHDKRIAIKVGDRQKDATEEYNSSFKV